VVRDLSDGGAGLEWSGQSVDVGDRIVLDLRLGRDRGASIRLRGEVRHACVDTDGAVRAGIEFVELGTLEATLLQRLIDDLLRNQRAELTALSA
jgi:hypothetical protein